MKFREKGSLEREFIETLYKKGIEEDVPFWKSLAVLMNRPRRKRVEVSLAKIEKYSSKNETVVVPGVVVSQGEIKDGKTVYAWKFTKNAGKKISKAGGICLPLQDIAKKSPRGLKVRILT